MYRILVAPVAQQLLSSLSDPLLRQVGRLLAETAEEAGRVADQAERARERALQRLELHGLKISYALDPAAQTLTVRRIAAPR